MIKDLLPLLYLKGVSAGDFSERLAAQLGPDAPGLWASTITRLKADWWDDYEHWSKRDLSARRYVYFRADGACFTPRLDEDRDCMLMIIGTPEVVCPKTTGGVQEHSRSFRRQSREHPEPPLGVFGQTRAGQRDASCS